MSAVRVFSLIAALSCAACLVSDEPLFDASNARATPLGEGRYSACSHSTSDEESECNPLEVRIGDSGLYLFELADADRMEGRFRKVGRNAYAAQLVEDGGGAMYYFGADEQGLFTLTMIECEKLPSSLREKLVAKGDMATRDDGEVCEASSARAVVAAAKAYAKGAAGDDRGYIVFHPSAGQ